MRSKILKVINNREISLNIEKFNCTKHVKTISGFDLTEGKDRTVESVYDFEKKKIVKFKEIK